MQALNQDCAICYNQLTTSYIAVHPEKTSLDLQHIFHRSCIEMWMYEKSSCPICRKEITELEPEAILQARKQRFIEAAQNGDIAQIQELLDLGFIPTAAKIEAFAEALFNNQRHVALHILEHKKDSHSFQKVCIVHAAARGDLEIYQLIHSRMQITQSERELCMIEAACHGHLEFIEKMFELGPISEDAIGAACNAAIDHIFSDLVPLLMVHGNIPYLERSKACIKLAQRDDFYLVDFLLKSGPISDVAKVRVIAYATFHGRKSFADNLKRQVPIFEETYQDALMIAVRERRTKESMYYVRSGSLSSQALLGLINRCIETNQIYMLEELLKCNLFSYSQLSQAKHRAIHAHHERAINAITNAMQKHYLNFFLHCFY